MSKLMIAMPSDKTPPLYDFFNDELNEKQRQKLLSLFALMLQAPVSVMREPYVKHFTLERYSSLYELRAKSKTLVRIIFTMTPDGDVLFLTPFVKQHRRDTMQALESSLSLLDRMRDGSCSYQELSIEFFVNRLIANIEEKQNEAETDPDLCRGSCPSAALRSVQKVVETRMRRLAVFLSLLCLLSLPVSAAYIPESSVTENRDGRQLIIKTYQLSPEDDPSELVDEPFDLEGYHYEHLETVKEDQTFHDSKAHTETVTVTTSSDSLAAILEQLAPTMEYSKDGYSGVLTLDHTTLQTEAAGYTTKYYTITDTKQFTGLPRNDPSYVPTTTVKDGKTLSLSNISWAVTGTGLADDTLVPTSYTATATYQATGSRSAATGYITTATYTGEITSEGIGSVQYTVTYLGTQLKSGFSIGLPLLVLLAAGLAMLAAILAFLYLRRPNAAIYAMNAKGVAYKKLGRQRIAVRNPKLDFTKLKEYPAGDSSVELKNKLARKLAGRLISIRLYDGVRTHLVEPIDGNETENYWFAVKDEDKEGSEL